MFYIKQNTINTIINQQKIAWLQWLYNNKNYYNHNYHIYLL